MANNRVYRPTTTDADQTKQLREIAEESREILKQPPPDTFLGRKTQAPFPKAENDD
jgi:hypothetical protein